MSKLRPLQTDLVNGIYAAWSSGARIVMPVLPTGGGKTVVIGKIHRDYDLPSIAVAHRQELVGQISTALAREGVVHDLLTKDTKSPLRRKLNDLHMQKFGRTFLSDRAIVHVGGVDTVKNMADDPRMKRKALCTIDEGHHVLKHNKWGKLFGYLPDTCYGLLPTATPRRADGMGLGIHADGLVDAMVEGPQMRQMINMGYLTDYQVACPKVSDLDLQGVDISATTGDYNQDQLRKAIRKSSKIVGDVVQNYLKLAAGKQTIVFAVDVEECFKIESAFRSAGVKAAAVHGEMHDGMRGELLRQFEGRELQVLINVDLFGEGFDVPGIECVIMARPTASFSLYCLDPETEVLTPSGWKRHDTIHETNEVVAFDIHTGETRAMAITSEIKRAPYAHEKMYCASGPHLDIAVSDKHDLIVRSNSSTSKNWKKQNSEVVAQRKSMYKIPVAGRGVHTGSGLTVSELQFLGWFLSDGGLNKSNQGVTIVQSAKKLAHLDSIRKSIVGCGFKFGEHLVVRKNCPDTHSNSILFTISKGAPRGSDKHLTGWGRLEKWINKSIPECYDTLTRDEFLILLETLNLGDGNNEDRSLDYKRGTLIIACGTNLKMADRVQALCVTRGLRCNIAAPQYEGCSKWYYLNIRDCDTATLPGTAVSDGSVGGKKPYMRTRLVVSDYRPEFVWCVSNDLGTLITRRNGKVAIVGNCQQWGRCLRLFLTDYLTSIWDTFSDSQRRQLISESPKPFGLIIDMVGNIIAHNYPDKPQVWTLDRREKRAKGSPLDAIPLRTCLNLACLKPYERSETACPFCGEEPPLPTQRKGPEFVDGDLLYLDMETLAKMRGDVAHVDGYCHTPGHVPEHVKAGIIAKHNLRQDQQRQLRETIAQWAGYNSQHSERVLHKRFYLTFGLTVLDAKALNAADATTLKSKIESMYAK